MLRNVQLEQEISRDYYVITKMVRKARRADRLEIIVETIGVYSPLKTGEIYWYRLKPDWQSINEDSAMWRQRLKEAEWLKFLSEKHGLVDIASCP